MTASEREIGELIGKVEAIGEQLAGMQRRNSAEHASVIARLDGLQEGVDQKVDWRWMKEQKIPERLNSLETLRDEGKGAARLVRFVQGAMGAAVVILGYLASHGGTG